MLSKRFFKYQFNSKIIQLHSNGGSEFQTLKPLLSASGIQHLLSCLYAHQQMGSVEQKYCHVVETRLTLLAHASAPKKYWPEAFGTAVYLINWLLSPVHHGKSPYKCLFNCSHDYQFLRIFSAACWPNLCPFNKNKIDYHSVLCIFLGYSLDCKGYRRLHPSSGHIYVFCDVQFDEHIIPFQTSSPPLH